jgi:hypothetical protein
VDENEMGSVETIYIDNKLSDYFDVPYQMMVNRQLLTLVLRDMLQEDGTQTLLF